MANLYVSSVAYSAIVAWGSSPFTASASVTLGQITRQSAPAVNSERAFRVSTAGTLGTLEPTWQITSNATTNESGHGGTAVWTECTAQESHQHDNGVTTTWTAPAARFGCIFAAGKNIVATGDTVFVSSDHAETGSAVTSIATSNGTSVSPITVIAVDRTTTNLPPLAADVLSGASVTTTSNASNAITVGATSAVWYGITFTTSGGFINLGRSAGLCNRFVGCAFAGSSVTPTAAGNRIILENCSMAFTAVSQNVVLASVSSGFEWRNPTGATAISGTMPTGGLFNVSGSGSNGGYTHVEALDLSPLGSNAIVAVATAGGHKMLMHNCRLGTSYTAVTNGGSGQIGPVIEFVNCASGATNYNNERHTGTYDLTTDTSTTLSGGASDGVTAFAHKIVTTAFVSTLVEPGISFPILKWNTVVGSSVSVNVELVSSAALKDNEIWLEVDYIDSASYPLGAIKSTFPATLITTGSNVTTSTATWTNAPATPSYQVLSLTFTPNMAGWIRGVVKVGKISKSVWINPQFT